MIRIFFIKILIGLDLRLLYTILLFIRQQIFSCADREITILPIFQTRMLGQSIAIDTLLGSKPSHDSVRYNGMVTDSFLTLLAPIASFAQKMCIGFLVVDKRHSGGVCRRLKHCDSF